MSTALSLLGILLTAETGGFLILGLLVVLLLVGFCVVVVRLVVLLVGRLVVVGVVAGGEPLSPAPLGAANGFSEKFQGGHLLVE